MPDGRIGETADRQWPPALVARSGTTGLAIARGLRETGVPVVGASLTPGAPVCRSNLWHSILRVPAPTEDAWLATLREAHNRYGRMMLFPADDTTVRIVAEHAAELATKFDYVMPELLAVDRLLDKAIFHDWAEENGFPVPPTAVVGNHEELRAALRDIPFPVVLKPFERTLRWHRLSTRKIYRLNHVADLDRLSFDLFDAAGRLVVQEFVPGRDSDVYFCLTYRNRRGEELGALVGRKISQWPLDTGNTALAVTHQDPELHKLTTRLLDAAGHVGFGSLEVRIDARDGRMLITEPTVGRPDLQTALAAASGVNLVDIAYRDALGLLPHHPARPSGPSREAIWVHETAFPQALLASAQRPDDRRTLLASVRRRRRAVGVFFSVRDPLPFVFEAVDVARRIVRAARDRTRRCREPAVSGFGRKKAPAP